MTSRQRGAGFGYSMIEEPTASIKEDGRWERIHSEANEVMKSSQTNFYQCPQEAEEEEKEASRGRPLFCSLSPEIGPCEFNRRRYFFNATSNLCEEFTFGGCKGNENRFNDAESCRRICKKTQNALQTSLETESFSDFEFDFGGWNVYKWRKFYYDSSEGRDFSIDVPPIEESLGSSNEVIK